MIYELRFDSESVVGYRGVGEVSRSEVEYLVKSVFNRLKRSSKINVYLDLAYVTVYDQSLRWVVKIYEVLYPKRISKIKNMVIISKDKQDQLPLDCPEDADIAVYEPQNRAKALLKVLS